ncbi:CsiV family protein [Pseudohaliea rubra]|uniref:Peptidoglycan-binding protein CsiV n=1 Tax=Pseudohaliea rubra DSM 19751 TaxID=1265313 RepID=A0A095XUJ7_9GAMM|nr:CsiV family protein [Pseudohaliea rubra]KGE03371.1 hypothetical protein HRUBRA_02057 [Pseudohaliea rubra DSM 19751]
MLAALFALPVLALEEEEEAPPWYRVELLVFRHTDPGALSTEAWPVYPAVAYPERYRFLVDRALADRRLAAHPGADSRIDERGRQQLRLAPPQLAPDPNEPPPVVPDFVALLPLEPARPDGHVGAVLPLEPTALNAPPDPNAPPPLPPAFTTLDRRALPAGRLTRDGAYEVLWHEAWLQPLADKSEAVPLLLDRSGDPDQVPWPRLQGSVRLYLSRYLHLETALWLNTKGSYLPEGWRAEPPPLAPASLVLEAALLPQRDPARALLAGEPWRPDARLADGALASDESSTSGPAASISGSDDTVDASLPQDPNEADPGWPWRHSIVLEAQRRMRSNETHYIDHPVFGVVVRIEPLAPQEKDSLGEALARPDWDTRHGRAAAPPATLADEP